MDVRPLRLREDAQAFRGRVAVETDHERLGYVEFVDGFENAERHLFARGDAAVHVDQHGMHLRVGQHDFEACAHRLRRGAATDVEEVGRLHAGPLFLAGERDRIERAHDKAGAVADHTNLAVEMHIVQSVLLGPALIGVGLVRVIELRPAVVAEGGVAVERDLRVKRAQVLARLVVRVADLGERINLHERGVVVLEAFPHTQQDLRGLRLIGMVEPDAAGHLHRRIEVEIVKGADMQALDRFGVLAGDLLDLGAAVRGGEHIEIAGFGVLAGDLLDLGAAVRGGEHIEIAGGAVHGDRYIILMEDVLGLRHKHAAHLVAVNRHGQDLLCRLDCFVTVVRDLDATGLTAVADLDLCLDDHGESDGLRGLGHILYVAYEDGLRGFDPLLFQQVSGLVFVKIHESLLVVDGYGAWTQGSLAWYS